MDTLNRYPWDIDKIGPGTVISAERCQQITGTSIRSAKHAMALLRLREQLMSDLEAVGRPLTVRVDGGSLRVLTHAEASQYNHGELERGMRKMMRAHRRTLMVDVSALTDEQAKEHRRRVLADGHRVAALVQANKEIPKLLGHERAVPGVAG